MAEMAEDERHANAPLDREPFDQKVLACLGRQLRRLFNETAAEPIPDRFTDLLERLDRETRPQPRRAPRQGAL